jgi:triosephosphate isomerase
MKPTVFAGNWKMHLGPGDARAYMRDFLSRCRPAPDRVIWLFPPAVSLEAVVGEVGGRPDILVGAQHIHWEASGAFTGELGITMARQVGARAALVGHSERRHLFGETDQDTARKVRALLTHDMTPVLCVGEKLEEREAGTTLDVVHRQLGALKGLDAEALTRVVIAYEPVWAIGTGRNATPGDAARVHAAIRAWFADQGGARAVTVLYGGSVKPDNVRSLVCEPEVDGVLVGGASTDPVVWAAMADTRCD